MDNTAVTAGVVTSSATIIGGGAWAAVAMELDPSNSYVTPVSNGPIIQGGKMTIKGGKVTL
jgi:hypothetical protein